MPGSSHIAWSFRQQDELVTNKIDICKKTIPLKVLAHSKNLKNGRTEWKSNSETAQPDHSVVQY